MENDISVLRAERINEISLNENLSSPEPMSLNTYSRENMMSSSNIYNSTTVFQDVMVKGIGLYVICDFIVGSNQPSTREGILKEVGRDYFIIYNDESDTTTVCGMDSLKFATFYRMGSRPRIGI